MASDKTEIHTPIDCVIVIAIYLFIHFNNKRFVIHKMISLIDGQREQINRIS